MIKAMKPPERAILVTYDTASQTMVYGNCRFAILRIADRLEDFSNGKPRLGNHGLGDGA